MHDLSRIIFTNYNIFLAPIFLYHCYYYYSLILVPRSYGIASDPFRHQIEYTRALNAAKLERVFAKPFLTSLDGHNEAVHILKKHPTRLSIMLSGARDGEVKVWHLTSKKCISTLQAHNGPINGIANFIN